MIYGWTIMLVAFVAAVVIGRLRGHLRLLSPYTWFLIPYGLIFIVRPLALLVTNNYERLEESVAELTDVLLIKASLLSALGLMCFVVGFDVAMRARAGRRIRLPRIRWSGPLVVVVGIVFGALALSVLNRMDLLPIPGRPIPHLIKGTNLLEQMERGATGYVLLAPHFLTAVLLLWASRFGVRWWVLALGVLVWFTGLYGGWHRWTVVLSAIALAFIEVAVQGRRRVLWALIAVSPAALLLLSAVGRARGLLPAVVAQEAQLGEFVGRGAETVNWDTDVAQFDGLVWSVWAFPEYGNYEFGRSIYESWVLGPIPRQLWSGKPTGRHRALREDAPEAAAGGGYSKSVIGTSYIDLGIPGVAIALGIIGWLLATTYNVFRRHRRMKYVVFLYCTGLSLLPILVRSGLAPMPVYLFFWTLPGLVVCAVGVVVRVLRGAESPDRPLVWPVARRSPLAGPG